MDIRSAKFETSATNCKKMMGSGKAEIAFVGRRISEEAYCR